MTVLANLGTLNRAGHYTVACCWTCLASRKYLVSLYSVNGAVVFFSWEMFCMGAIVSGTIASLEVHRDQVGCCSRSPLPQQLVIFTI